MGMGHFRGEKKNCTRVCGSAFLNLTSHLIPAGAVRCEFDIHIHHMVDSVWNKDLGGQSLSSNQQHFNQQSL